MANQKVFTGKAAERELEKCMRELEAKWDAEEAAEEAASEAEHKIRMEEIAALGQFQKASREAAKPQPKIETTIAGIQGQLAECERQMQAVRDAWNAADANSRFDGVTFNAISARKAALKLDLERAQKEQRTKEEYRKNYLAKSFATNEDFEESWTKSLRDEAIRDLVTAKVPDVDHNIFAASWNQE